AEASKSVRSAIGMANSSPFAILNQSLPPLASPCESRSSRLGISGVGGLMRYRTLSDVGLLKRLKTADGRLDHIAGTLLSGMSADRP
uniref:hypothetical protein n=1 Tax=Sphingomonas populi TaxID=2484750 RepID=UPI0019CF824A